LRQALELRGGDFSANYYSAQLYETLGAPDLAMPLLDRLASSIPTSAQQIELVRRPERLAKQRSDLAARIAERTPSAPAAADLPSALAALRAGLPGSALPRLEQWARTATELSDDGRAACDALLALGHGATVANFLSGAGASAEPGWRDLRLGAALFIERQFAQARVAWESVPASSAERASADFCLAFLAAIHGDKDGLRRAVASGLRAKPDVAVEQSLRELEALFQETKTSSAK
jgi:hypothetical protein